MNSFICQGCHREARSYPGGSTENSFICQGCHLEAIHNSYIFKGFHLEPTTENCLIFQKNTFLQWGCTLGKKGVLLEPLFLQRKTCLQKKVLQKPMVLGRTSTLQEEPFSNPYFQYLIVQYIKSVNEPFQEENKKITCQRITTKRQIITKPVKRFSKIKIKILQAGDCPLLFLFVHSPAREPVGVMNKDVSWQRRMKLLSL